MLDVGRYFVIANYCNDSTCSLIVITSLRKLTGLGLGSQFIDTDDRLDRDW